MADKAFDVALGSIMEKCRDDATKFGVLLLKTAEADGTLITRATVAAILAAANTEADFTNYVRHTGITATLSIASHVAKVTIPTPQTWLNAGGATNNALAKFIVFYDEGGSDATRIPLLALDCVITTNGLDLDININASGLCQAA